MTQSSGEIRRIWTAPVLIAVATLFGLVAALLADGLWDRVSAALLFAALTYAVALGLRGGPSDSSRRAKQ